MSKQLRWEQGVLQDGTAGPAGATGGDGATRCYRSSRCYTQGATHKTVPKKYKVIYTSARLDHTDTTTADQKVLREHKEGATVGTGPSTRCYTPERERERALLQGRRGGESSH